MGDRSISISSYLLLGTAYTVWTGIGAVGAFAMPPFGVLPALAVSLPVAVWLLDGAVGEGRAAPRSAVVCAAVIGWWWGFGYFVAGLWWLGAAFLVACDVLSRTLMSPLELPVGIITALIGGPFFLWLLIRRS